jgi:hypothetical protein
MHKLLRMFTLMVSGVVLSPFVIAGTAVANEKPLLIPWDKRSAPKPRVTAPPAQSLPVSDGSQPSKSAPVSKSMSASKSVPLTEAVQSTRGMSGPGRSAKRAEPGPPTAPAPNASKANAPTPSAAVRGPRPAPTPPAAPMPAPEMAALHKLKTLDVRRCKPCCGSIPANGGFPKR